MANGLNTALQRFAAATAHCGDAMRMTMRDDKLMADRKDVGLFRRIAHIRQSTRNQIVENNRVRTYLLNALTAQFQDRGGIPESVKAALNGSSPFGKDDMKHGADNEVCSGRPLTARRVRLILDAVNGELAKMVPPKNTGNGEIVATRLKEEQNEMFAPMEDNRALGEFRKRMREDGDARIMNGINQGDSGKDPVTQYAEAFAREMITELVDEDYDDAQDFWRSVGSPDPSGEAELDDVTSEFARGLSKNQDVFDRLSQAIRKHICSGGTPQGLKDVRKCVISDALKDFRKKDEPLPLNNKTIFGFKTGMSQKEIDDVELRVTANASRISQDAKWFNAYTQQTIESLQKNTAFARLLSGSVDKTTSGMFMQALRESYYVFDRVHDVIDDSIRHGKTHAEVQADVQKSITDFLFEFSASRNSVKGTESKGAIAPKQHRAPTGLSPACKLPSGVVLTQGQNTCPIIGLTNAMLMTSGETAEKAKAFMTRHQEGNRSYFEFPDPDNVGKKIRAYTDEFKKEYPNNTANLSDFEKAVFVALKKANLRITNEANETQPGNVFEISPVFVLFGFKEPESIGNIRGDRPSEMQKCLDGKKIAEAIKAGKPCVLGAPGHFVGIESVKFDAKGLPTYTYFNSSSRRLGTLKPINNTGYQFYIGEKAEEAKE